MTLRPNIPTPAHRSSLVSALCLTALLAACANLTPTPTQLPSISVPTAWSNAGDTGAKATQLVNWWQHFNDPELSTLVTQALATNTSVKGAQAALRQARAQRDVQTAHSGPTFNASGSAQRSQNGDAVGNNRFQVGFDASWEPDVFGGNRAAVSASEADARAAETVLADIQVSLAAEVAAGYMELRGLQARLEIARNNLTLQNDSLQLTRWRHQAGLASALEVEQGVTTTEQTRAQIPALQTGVAQSLNALAVLTGQAPGALQAALGTAAAVPQTPPDLALAFPAETLRQRPDVRSAEHRISAALARVNAAEAARYPSFRLGGSLGLSALTLGTLTDGASVLRSLLSSVSAPLFDGGAAKAQVRAQEAALEQARLNYQATVLSALKDVEDALVALHGNTERLARLQAASTAAAQAELLARQRYQSGLIDFRTVLDTQRSLLSTQDSVASTQATLSADHVRLYKALGGGWTPDAVGDATAIAR